MMPRPPSSTLFPYTTLFRSIQHSAATKRARHEPVRSGAIQHSAATKQPRRRAAKQPRRRARKLAEKTHSLQVDRKSTRLNSSHVEISYAVFCLKKKKKKNTR